MVVGLLLAAAALALLVALLAVIGEWNESTTSSHSPLRPESADQGSVISASEMAVEALVTNLFYYIVTLTRSDPRVACR